jgi:hypothetical protein
LAQPGMAALSFEERLALLVDREVHSRNDRTLLRLLKNAHLKYAQATIEDIDTRPSRGIDHREVMSMALGDWVSAGHSVLITGPTGAGKSWLACALAQHACRRGYSAVYQRVPPPSPTPSSIASCSAIIALTSLATRCGQNDLKPAKRRKTPTYRDRTHYNLAA